MNEDHIDSKQQQQKKKVEMRKIYLKSLAL